MHGTPLLALTFDDGPTPHTEAMLDVLAKYNVPATFMMLGHRMTERPHTVQRAITQGCEVLGHSWDHANLTQLPPEDVRMQLEKTAQALADAAQPAGGTQPLPGLFRAPYGAHNESVRHIAQDLGMSLVAWSLDTVDWKHHDTQHIYDVLLQAADGDIVLMHDNHEHTAQAVEKALPILLAQGFAFVTVSQLLQARGVDVVPGAVYYHARV